MKVRIKPLDGKYYETVIAGDVDGKEFCIQINSTDREPSGRELALVGIARSDWDANVLVDDGWGGKVPVQQSESVIDPGGHYERRLTHEIACKIIAVLSAEGSQK
jgi:hypothetical protein